MGVFLRLLGGLRLETEGEAVGGRAIHRKRLALLALLGATPGGRLSRDKLIAFLWPESDADRARHQLASSVYELRKALGEAVIDSVGDDLLLGPALVRSDVADFDAAMAEGDRERAAGLYAGPFLDGFFVSDAPEFEQWAEGERARLAQAYAKALEELAQERSSRGEAVAAVQWWRRLATHDPYNGRVALRLIEALEAAGDRVGALKHAQAHAQSVRTELGVEPDPQILAAHVRLRAAAAEARPSGLSASSASLPPASSMSASAWSTTPVSSVSLPSPSVSSAPLPRRAFLAVAAALAVALAVLTVTGGWSRMLAAIGVGTAPQVIAKRVPVVLMMDSPHPSRVYDQEVLEASGTNADVINDLLRDLPIQRVKEAAGPYWHRHEEIRQLQPDLVLIHFSAFCTEVCEDDRIKMRAFLEYMAGTRAHFLIYSRKPPDVFARDMKDMLGDLPQRHPELLSRIHPFAVRTYGSPHWKDPATAAAFKLRVKELLGLGM